MEKANRNNLKNMFIGFSVILLYLISSTFIYDFIEIFGIKYSGLNNTLRAIYIVCYQSILTLIIIYIYRKNFIPDFKDFKKNFKTYIDKYIKYWFLMLGLMFLSNIIITRFTTVEVAENQETIIKLLKEIPIYTFVTTVIIAPFLEELVFRLSFRKIFAKTDILFILFSGLVFGSMHVIGTCTTFIDLLFIIPYSIPGFIFAYIYSKSRNICIPISIHLLHNGIMMILQLLLLLVN